MGEKNTLFDAGKALAELVEETIQECAKSSGQDDAEHVKTCKSCRKADLALRAWILVAYTQSGQDEEQ